MKLHARYVEAMLAEAQARTALQEANFSGDIDAKAFALANVIYANQVSRDAFDARSQHQHLGASTLAAEARERAEIHRHADENAERPRTIAVAHPYRRWPDHAHHRLSAVQRRHG